MGSKFEIYSDPCLAAYIIQPPYWWNLTPVPRNRKIRTLSLDMSIFFKSLVKCAEYMLSLRILLEL